jgi:hypothetical protein
MLLRGIFVPKKDEILGGWGKLHNEELHNSYSSTNKNDQVKECEMSRTCSTCGD